MKKIVDVLLWIWQLPQHLLALCILAYNKMRGGSCEKVITEGITWYKIKYIMNCGVSLGNYIFLDSDTHNYYNIPVTIKHEHGHSIQSRIFGPLYLLAVGIPSAIGNNLVDRLFHKKWTSRDRSIWYYSRYPEKWADKLGGVDRGFPKNSRKA